jgi:hypothetical protein
MNYFWSNLSELANERRYAPFFVGALVAFFAAVVGGALFYQLVCAIEWPGALAAVLAGLGLILLVFIHRCTRRLRTRRSKRHKIAPLSRDELAKARSKLTTKPTFKSS